MALPTASDNVFPKILSAVQSSDPAAPSDGSWKIYSKAGGIYARSSNSVVGPFSTGSGGISSGTSNPGSPTNGDLFYRSDLDLLIRYRSSGTRWVCTCPHELPVAFQDTLNTVSATGSRRAELPQSITAAILIESLNVGIHVTTTNNATNFWTVKLSVTGDPSVDTSAIAANTTTRLSNTSTNLPYVCTIATDKWVQIDHVKTLSPGAAYITAGIGYRYIVT